MAKIWSNSTSIDNMWSVCKILDSVPSVTESMPQNASKDLYCYMYFVDDWGVNSDSECNEYFMDTKVRGVGTTATH